MCSLFERGHAVVFASQESHLNEQKKRVVDGHCSTHGIAARHNLSAGNSSNGVSLYRSMERTTEMDYLDGFSGRVQFQLLKFQEDSTIGFINVYVPQPGARVHTRACGDTMLR